MIAIALPNWELDLVTYFYAIEFLLPVQGRLGRSLRLICAWLRPWGSNDVPPCGMIKAPYRWDRSRERREREAAQVASFGAYGVRQAGKLEDWNGRNGQAAKLQDLRPAIGHE